MSQNEPPVRDEAPAAVPDGAPSPRISLRAMYASAMTTVKADPAAALADYQSFLSELIEARRQRGD